MGRKRSKLPTWVVANDLLSKHLPFGDADGNLVSSTSSDVLVNLYDVCPWLQKGYVFYYSGCKFTHRLFFLLRQPVTAQRRCSRVIRWVLIRLNIVLVWAEGWALCISDAAVDLLVVMILSPSIIQR